MDTDRASKAKILIRFLTKGEFASSSSTSLILTWDGKSMPTMSRINPIVLRYIAAEVKAQSFQAEHLFRGMGFTEEILNSDPYFAISYRQASEVIRRALRLTQDHRLGYLVGRRRSLVATGFAGLGFLTCNSPREASSFLADYPWAFGTLLAIEAKSTEDRSIVITAATRFSDPEVDSFLVDEFFSSLRVMFQLLIGQDFAPQQIQLTCTKPSHAPEMTDFFACPMKFGKDKNLMVIDAAAADKAPPSADAAVHRGIIEKLNEFALSSPTSDICATIEQIFREKISSPPTLPQLATLLHTSERSLRRRLVEESTSYQQLLDGVRKYQAILMLQSGKSPISVVTKALGFSDARNFRRAVQRWTGQAPTAVRKK